jgi:hypothetical protein
MKCYLRISAVHNVLSIPWTGLLHQVPCVAMMFILPLGMYGCFSPMSVDAYGGLVGYASARAPASAQAWKRLAEAHCPDKAR